MKYIVYILKSQKNKSYYVGSTDNIKQRLVRHNKGYNKSTRNGRLWKLVYIEFHITRKDAINRESDIKNKKSRKYIENLISGGGSSAG